MIESYFVICYPYAQDNKYNHNAKCSLPKDTSNQWISTFQKTPQFSSRDTFGPHHHIYFSIGRALQYTVQRFSVSNFPKHIDPAKTPCIHLLHQEQNQLGEWPLLSQGVYTGMFICCFLHQSTCSYSPWSRSLSSIYSALPSRRNKTPSRCPSLVDAQWPDNTTAARNQIASLTRSP